MLFTYTENGEFKRLETDVFLIGEDGFCLKDGHSWVVDSFKNDNFKLAFYEGRDGELTIHNEVLYLEYIKSKV